ncbi:helix-turn-helix domain-containing protein [Hyphococcus luteus]
MITKEQCRAARALIGWSRSDLASAAKVSERTITDFERGARSPIHASLAAIAQALESGGVEFIPENGGGPGVRLAKPQENDSWNEAE